MIQDYKTKTFIFVLEAPRDQDPGLNFSRTTSLIMCYGGLRSNKFLLS